MQSDDVPVKVIYEVENNQTWSRQVICAILLITSVINKIVLCFSMLPFSFLKYNRDIVKYRLLWDDEFDEDMIKLVKFVITSKNNQCKC